MWSNSILRGDGEGRRKDRKQREGGRGDKERGKEGDRGKEREGGRNGTYN